MDKRIKFGIAGTGGIFYGWGGGSGHLPGCAWMVDEARLAAICDVSATSLEKAAVAVRKLYQEKAAGHKENGRDDLAKLLLADSENLKLYTSLEDMLKAEKLDFADIITPCEHHLAAIRQSLDAGCHVLCEKPLTRTWLESEKVVRDVANAGKILLYGENLIYADPYHDIRKLILKGEIGELEAIWLPLSISEPGNYSYTKGGIGALLDMGIHNITLAWFLAGFDYTPKRVKALSPDGVSNRIKQRLLDGVITELNVEDYASFVVEFENPASGQWINTYLEASWSFGDRGGFRVVGSNGEIRIEDGKIVVVDQFGNAHGRNFFHTGTVPPGYGGHPQQLRAMARLVRENAQPSCDAKIASESLAIAQAVYLSEARGRKAVTLPEFKEYAQQFDKNPEELLRELLKTGVSR
ncbi:MAG: Gfo/Idh/MocA family oxidoreductase [Kiritimatiellaeota bacterium]|nr:Gfo/Idh/MocA family oxidoreductase [Kiritimatiellota bacterium]